MYKEIIFYRVTIDKCDITVRTGVDVVKAPAAGVAASHGATLTVKDSTISGNMEAAYFVYQSGGKIIAENNTIDDAVCRQGVYKNGANNGEAVGSIVIDGITVA